MDTNKDGQLSKGEFGKTMKNLSRKQVDRVYDKFDKDRDQKLSEGEFGNMINLDVIKKHQEKTNPKIVISWNILISLSIQQTLKDKQKIAPTHFCF